MSFLDSVRSSVSRFFESTPAQAQQIPVTVVHLDGSAYQQAPARLAPTTPRGAERNFQAPPAAPHRASSEASGTGAAILGGILIVGGALLSESGVGIAMMAAGAAMLTGCGPNDEANPDFNANVPEASVPVTQDQWCEGLRSLTAAPIPLEARMAQASVQIARFPGISDDLRNLPEGMNAIGIAPQEASEGAPYAYVLIQNRRPVSEREATEQSSYVLLYERNAMGRYVPSQVRGNDPLGSLHNVVYQDSLDADSITYVSAETFRQNSQPDGARRTNLFVPSLTDGNRIAIRFDNSQITLLPYGPSADGNIRPLGGADVCSFYGQSLQPRANEAGTGIDATATDAAPRDGSLLENNRDGGMDAGRDGSADARSDANRDTGAERAMDGGVDAGSDAGRRDAGLDASDARQDATADAARDAGSDARSDASADASRG